MKALMLLGGMIGLAIGLGFGLAGRAPWPDALWRAAAAALAAGVMLRWWGRVWIRSLRAAHEQRHAELVAAQQMETPKKK